LEAAKYIEYAGYCFKIAINLQPPFITADFYAQKRSRQMTNPKKEIKFIIRRAVNLHMKNIADHILMEIEGSKDLMKSYGRLVENWIESTGSASRESMRGLDAAIMSEIKNISINYSGM
jgi:hypothetical protein